MLEPCFSDNIFRLSSNSSKSKSSLEAASAAPRGLRVEGRFNQFLYVGHGSIQLKMEISRNKERSPVGSGGGSDREKGYTKYPRTPVVVSQCDDGWGSSVI